MDAAINPPVRLQATSATSISAKRVQKHLDNFLDDFQARSTASQGGNTAVTVQLQKLRDALQEERQSNDVRTAWSGFSFPWFLVFNLSLDGLIFQNIRLLISIHERHFKFMWHNSWTDDDTNEVLEIDELWTDLKPYLPHVTESIKLISFLFFATAQV